MADWLLKTEPTEYSWDDLARDGKAEWDGISNATALKNLRAMKKGDRVLLYHTGNEKAVVGIAEITSAPRADSRDKAGKLVIVDIKTVSKLAKPVTLAMIKLDPAFAGWDLLRIGRLSVVPVPAAMWKRVQTLSKP